MGYSRRRLSIRSRQKLDSYDFRVLGVLVGTGPISRYMLASHVATPDIDLLARLERMVWLGLLEEEEVITGTIAYKITSRGRARLKGE